MLMTHSGAPTAKITPKPADSLRLESALCASEVAVWSLDLATGNLLVSSYFYELLPDFPQPAQVGDLLSLLSAADSYMFEKTFVQPALARSRSKVRGHQQQIVSCKIHLPAQDKASQLQFIGRLCSVYHANEQRLCYQGIAVNANHWLANPTPDYTRHLLSALLSESQIPTLVTDGAGTVLQKNRAADQLFKLSADSSDKAIKRYNLLRDRSLHTNLGAFKKVKQVYERNETKSIELEYGLDNLHRNQLYKDIRLLLRADFLPLKDRSDKVSRVLIQLQNFPLQNAIGDSTDQHHLLRNLIDNSPSLISIKSIEGKYFLVNASFCHWLGCSANDICGKTDVDLFDKSSAEFLELQDQKVFQSADGLQV